MDDHELESFRFRRILIYVKDDPAWWSSARAAWIARADIVTDKQWSRKRKFFWCYDVEYDEHIKNPGQFKILVKLTQRFKVNNPSFTLYQRKTYANFMSFMKEINRTTN